MVFQGLTASQSREIWKPFFDWASSAPELTVVDKLGAGAVPARNWWNIEGNSSMIPDKRDGAPKHHGWWTGDQAQVGAFLPARFALVAVIALAREPASKFLRRSIRCQPA
jgi:hypothetical protein